MILMDTHIWVRWLCRDTNLPATLVTKLEKTELLTVSAISCWEVGYLARHGRLDLGMPVRDWLHAALEPSGVTVIPLDADIATIAAELPDHHRDPADRFIIATAIQHKAKLISFDREFAKYSELKQQLITR